MRCGLGEELRRGLRGDARVVDDQVDVEIERAPARELGHPRQQAGSDVLAGDAVQLGGGARGHGLGVIQLRGRRPNSAAARTLAATVVAPTARCTIAGAMSRALTLIAPLATRSRSLSVSPRRSWPSRTATVAGTAPASRTAASQPRAARRLCGGGRPWPTIDVSSATTGRRAASAAATSDETSTRPLRSGAPPRLRRIGTPPARPA